MKKENLPILHHEKEQGSKDYGVSEYAKMEASIALSGLPGDRTLERKAQTHHMEGGRTMPTLRRTCIMKGTEASVGEEIQISQPFAVTVTHSFTQVDRSAKCITA